MKFEEGVEWFHKHETKPEEYIVEDKPVVAGKSFPLIKAKVDKVTSGEQRNYIYAVQNEKV